MIDSSFKDYTELVSALSSLTTAIGSYSDLYRRTSNEHDYGEGIVLKNISILKRRSKAHNRKTNRRNK